MAHIPVDLNLLVVFHAMAEHKSVTRAAEALSLSQPATSAALARLRSLLGDPLFVKSGHAMRPTPRALLLAPTVRQLLATVKDDILTTSLFEPTTSTRNFHLIAPDIAEVIVLPRILTRLREAAPQVTVKVISMPRLAAAEALELGTADLAIGYLPDLHKSGFFQQRLFKHAYVCIARQDHPSLTGRLSMKDYLAAPHAVVLPDGREHLMEQFLNAKQIRRNVVLELSHFMSLQTVIASSDLIATVPEDLAQFFAAHGKIQILPLPLKSPEVEVHQFWHKRLGKDPANMWLRGLVFDAMRPISHCL
jgi:DNA-binding transcriptional LysR family regulator